MCAILSLIPISFCHSLGLDFRSEDSDRLLWILTYNIIYSCTQIKVCLLLEELLLLVLDVAVVDRQRPLDFHNVMLHYWYIC